jgi:hypothetical protein
VQVEFNQLCQTLKQHKLAHVHVIACRLTDRTRETLVLPNSLKQVRSDVDMNVLHLFTPFTPAAERTALGLQNNLASNFSALRLQACDSIICAWNSQGDDGLP